MERLDFTTALSLADVERLVADTRRMVNLAVIALRPKSDSSAAGRGLRRAADLTAELGRELLGTRPPLVDRQVGAAVNVRVLAHRLYGDHTRAEEIRSLNPRLAQAGPLIPAGTELRVYAW